MYSLGEMLNETLQKYGTVEGSHGALSACVKALHGQIRPPLRRGETRTQPLVLHSFSFSATAGSDNTPVVSGVDITGPVFFGASSANPTFSRASRATVGDHETARRPYPGRHRGHDVHGFRASYGNPHPEAKRGRRAYPAQTAAHERGVAYPAIAAFAADEQSNRIATILVRPSSAVAHSTRKRGSVMLQW